jgi:hypothetical protein
MRKINLCVVLLALGIGAIVVSNLRLNTQNELSNILLANVEALTGEGAGTNVITCYSTYRVTLKNPNKQESLWNITKCNGCTEVSCYEYSDQGTCTKSSYQYV